MLIIKHLLFFSYHEINLVHGGNFYIPSLIEIILFIKLFTVGLIVALFKYKFGFFFLVFIYFHQKIKF